ncbi:AraC family transcriptional regulator [uncultured Fibrobacter sp.]|uniref:helix-turn-helix domain-containing protein n=1 Tax=uncultured Fibrobacter sp. TaxID=261512 RepID=UPI002805849F|nr:AraC family transcriptional regulator [uncultured Fibrobacter sp.]
MPEILKVQNVMDYAKHLGAKTSHPLVALIDYAAISPVPHVLNRYSVYGIFMHRHLSAELRYGSGKYKKDKGSLLCVAPGQIGGKEDNGERIHIDGYALLFHPDILRGSSLAREIRNYSFFDYSTNEALETTEEEFGVISSVMQKIQGELQNVRDKYQDKILLNYIELVLNFCMRFYDRQFAENKPKNQDILQKFDDLLESYFTEKAQHENKLPGISYFAQALCMSPHYFSDFIRKVTGNSASNYIRRYCIRQAKNQLAEGKSIGEVSSRLGFEYPEHFTRLFKKMTGKTPLAYKKGLCILTQDAKLQS